MTRVQVRHQHEGNARVRRAGAEELLEGFQSASRSTYADNGEVGGSRFRHLIHECRGGAACWPCSATGLADAVSGVFAMGFLVAMKIPLLEIDPRLSCHATPYPKAG